MPSYWIASISGNDSLEARHILEKMILQHHLFAFSHKTTMTDGDNICFYSTFTKSIVARATIISQAFEKSHGSRFPWTIKLSNISLCSAPQMSGALVQHLDAFSHKNNNHWSWFVWRPHRITEHDFNFLTSNNLQ